MCTESGNRYCKLRYKGDLSGVQCDHISEATGIQRAAAGGVDEEVQVDHVGVQCVQWHNGVQISHIRGAITQKWLIGRYPNL